MRIAQEAFAPPNNLASLKETPLVIHQRTSPTANRRLVVFVHGLGGSRYGSRSTWGRFPRFIFEDLESADVGLYEYRTLFRRNFFKSISLGEEAKVFANILRNLTDYTSIVLVGHSMGGLLCKAAIAHLLKTRQNSNLSRIDGLILMASPQLGTLRVPSFLGWFSSDARALKAHGDLVQEINETFENHLHLDESVDAADRLTLPTWVVSAAYDFWVDPLSAGIGTSSSRRQVIRGSHTEIVKPTNRTSESYTWVLACLKSAFQRFQYDVFLASPMAALDSQEAYSRYHEDTLKVEQALIEHCGATSVFYAGRGIKDISEFQGQAQSLYDDYKALKESRYFMMFYPEKKLSSVIYEAGMALALGKPAVYFVHETKHLPFLMQQAQQAFPRVRVTIHDQCDTADKVIRRIEQAGRWLFTREEDE